jgi:hypothetical protein
LFAF